MNECLTTPQRKNKLAIGCQTNDVNIKKAKWQILKIHIVVTQWEKAVLNKIISYLN